MAGRPESGQSRYSFELIRGLVNRKRGRLCYLLLGYVIVNRDGHLVLARLQAGQGHRPPHSQLVRVGTVISHRRAGFRRIQDRLVRRQIRDLVLNGGGILLAFVVDGQIVDLHPEIQLLAAMERDGNSRPGADPRPDVGVWQ